MITTFVGVDEHHDTEDGKRRSPAEQEKSQFARTNFLPIRFLRHRYFSPIISQKIAIFAYVLRLDCSIGFNNEGLLFSLSANAVMMI